jgi:acyl-CoA reductase-like NAD-dependent aldehyde dehydrogenase
MAGNAVLLKHAAQTLLAASASKRPSRVRAAEGLFQNLVLSHEQTERLIAPAESTMSTSPARSPAAVRFERAAAGTFARSAWGSGGKDPAYVREVAMLDGRVVTNSSSGAFFNSGQSCCGIEAF